MLDNAAPVVSKPLINAKTVAFLGIVAVAVILCSVAVLTAINLRRTSNGLNALSATQQVGDAYSQMTIAIALSSIYSDEYRRTGDPALSALMLGQIREALRQENLVKTLGTDSDRALVSQLERQYATELQGAALLLSGAAMPSEQMDPQILDRIVRAFAAPSSDARVRGLAQMNDFKDGFNSRSTATLLAFLAGLPMLGLLLFVIMRYERKDAIQAEELRKLGQAVLTDGLTGLHNHRSFQEDLRREVSRSSRSELPISVAMIDIDDFKVINDTMGHARGDAVLAQVAKLMTLLRSEDRAYRVGGDEFAIILPDTGADSAHQAIERLRRSIETAMDSVTISAGISTNHNGQSAAVLRDHADLALYEAKHRGKNQVARFTEDLDDGNEVTATKMTALRELLKEHAIEMWFQPIFRIESKELLAFEALLRMPRTPELSGPEEAFEIAQRMGRSHDLDLMCAGAALDAAGELDPGTKLFINLDPATLMHSDFSGQELLAMVEARNINPKRVVFEITEKTTAPISRLTRQVDALHECGFGVALDDVGSGNSGLEMLRLIKFDYVKIDRSVVLDAMNSGPGRAVILAIVAFARETGAFMIAEGIEDREMLESVDLDEAGLHSFWVQGVQGFFFGRPARSMAGYTQQPGIAAA
jgi:diguanylate cyclase (GGDEF)-like protein